MAEEDELNLPPGFRFMPTDEELITFYLKPKIFGQELPCNIVEEKQLYGDKTPWEVFNSENDKWQVSEISSGKMKKSIYVFAKLKKKKRGSGTKLDGKEQFVRAAGCGTWDGQTGPKEIINGNGEIIGVKKMLVFEINDTIDNLELLKKLRKENKTTGYWIMHEYSLYGVVSDYVVCEISRDDLRNSKIKNAKVVKRAKNSTSCRQDLVPLAEVKMDLVPLADVKMEYEQADTQLGGGGEDVVNCNGEGFQKELRDAYLDVDQFFNYECTAEIQAQASLLAERFEGGLEQQQNSASTSDIKALGKRKIEYEDATKKFCKKC